VRARTRRVKRGRKPAARTAISVERVTGQRARNDVEERERSERGAHLVCIRGGGGVERKHKRGCKVGRAGGANRLASGPSLLEPDDGAGDVQREAPAREPTLWARWVARVAEERRSCGAERAEALFPGTGARSSSPSRSYGSLTSLTRRYETSTSSLLRDASALLCTGAVGDLAPSLMPCALRRDGGRSGSEALSL
jgi:hypothetical protein